MNGTVAQRMLRTHQKKNDEGTQIDSTGDTGFINDYAKWLAKDTSALVDGDPVGLPGLIGTLKKAPVNGAAIKNELIDSVMSSGAWKEVNAKDLAELVTFVIKANDLSDPEEGETSAAYIAALNFAEDYADSVRKWISDKAALESASTVSAIAAVTIPLAWHTDLAYLVYEATKHLYYAARYVPYVPPFKGLIKDVNEGNVEEFEYERKYGAASHNWGAEFTVKAPQELKEKYAGKAVLHTHYPDASSEPNYAHTKPEDKKFEQGFGYTIVETDKVTSVADSSEAWSDL